MGTFIMVMAALYAIAAGGTKGSKAIYHGISSRNPSKAKVEADFRKIQTELVDKRPQLVPWSDEDRSLLSLKRKPYKEKIGSIKSAEGTFVSIYQEQMVLFHYKRYIGKQENAILVVMTSHHEFLYRIKNFHAEVAYNGKYLGSITTQYALVSEKKKEMAKIALQKENDYYPILVEGQDKGNIGDAKKAKKVNPRAFELLSQMSPNDELKLLALSFYFLVRNGFEKI